MRCVTAAAILPRVSSCEGHLPVLLIGPQVLTIKPCVTKSALLGEVVVWDAALNRWQIKAAMFTRCALA